METIFNLMNVNDPECQGLVVCELTQISPYFPAMSSFIDFAK